MPSNRERRMHWHCVTNSGTAVLHGISEMRVNCAPRISCSPFLFRTQERVDTILPDCPGRLSWRHRARPSATLHEIQARSQGANLNVYVVTQAPGAMQVPLNETFVQLLWGKRCRYSQIKHFRPATSPGPSPGTRSAGLS